MKFQTLCLLVLLLTAFTACRPEATDAPGGVTHARLLHIERADSFTRVDVLDPWRAGSVLHTYILVPRGQDLPTEIPAATGKQTLLRTPLGRVVSFSSVHASLLCDLGFQDAITGLCDTAYAFHPKLRHALEVHSALNMGSSMSPDVERIIMNTPDAVFVSPMEGSTYDALEAAGVPLVECADYMESTALGRAEWMKFFGLLFDCEALTDSLFDRVCTNYDSLRTAAAAASTRPSLLCDGKQGAAWYVPGGASYLGQLYADAGANYLFADRKESGSAALSVETVLAEGMNADVWFVKYGAAADMTYESLAADYAPYAQFAAWKARHIYGCNTLRVPYYEEVPFRPDLLLRDVVHILHPDVLPHHKLRYYTPLQ